VTNAIKYTDKGGVVIGEVAFADHVEVAVCDSGTGIDAVQQQHMFTEFSHAHRPGDHQSGLGLRLAIVRRSIDVLDSHNLNFYSRLGRGTRFSVRMPRALAASRAVANVRPPDSVPWPRPVSSARVAGPARTLEHQFRPSRQCSWWVR
jgi:signal transduction histidine kinase